MSNDVVVFGAPELVERDCPTDTWERLAAALATGPGKGLLRAMQRMGDAVAIAGGAVLAAEMGVPTSDVDVFVATADDFRVVLAECGPADFYRAPPSGQPIVALHVAGCVPVQIVLSADAAGRAANVIRGFDLDYCQAAIWIDPTSQRPRILETRFAQEAHRDRRVRWVLDTEHNSYRLAARVRKAARKGFPLDVAPPGVSRLTQLVGLRFYGGAAKGRRGWRDNFDCSPRPAADPAAPVPTWYLSHCAASYRPGANESIFTSLPEALAGGRLDRVCVHGYGSGTRGPDQAVRFVLACAVALPIAWPRWLRIKRLREARPEDQYVFHLWRVYRELFEPGRATDEALRETLRAAACHVLKTADAEDFARDYRTVLYNLTEHSLLDFVDRNVGAVP